MAINAKNSLDAIRAKSVLSSYIHPDYTYYRPEWDAVRDALAGERRVKSRGTDYLPALDVEYGTTYEVYKERAIFVNMVARTVLGLVGTIFRRPLRASNVEKTKLENVTLNGLDMNLFAKKLAFEVCALGRIGVLVDMQAGGKVYLTEYIAENILSWKTRIVNGREELTYVLLREITDQTPILDGNTPFVSNSSGYSSGLQARYRVLLLDNGVYKQRVYSTTGNDANPAFAGAEFTEITPTKNGKPFDFIPMKIIGPLSPTPEIQKSPVYDITSLNYAHYRTSAQLEHGRFYTALPVYYVPITGGQENGDYHVGPSVVWEVPEGQKPGILEYFGTGLKSLADSLTEKEEHIAQLGGRIMGIRPQATAESDNIFAMKQANEMSILLNITESMSAGLTQCLRWYLDWQRIPADEVYVTLNQDFKSLSIAARELRAISLLYQQNILPIQEVYRILQEAEFIGETVTLEEFKGMLDNLDNFPNQPDVAAMHEGYPNATAKLTDQQSQRQLNSGQSQAEMDRQHQVLIDQRRSDQQSELQDQMFQQSQQTARLENQLAIEKEKKTAHLKPAAGKTAVKSGVAKGTGGANRAVAAKK